MELKLKFVISSWPTDISRLSSVLARHLRKLTLTTVGSMDRELDGVGVSVGYVQSALRVPMGQLGVSTS